jgi:hypothetical protein
MMGPAELWSITLSREENATRRSGESGGLFVFKTAR